MSIGQKISASTLRFYLFERAVHPELFDIYHDRRVVKPGYEAHIWVTGCAHVIGFYRGDNALVQLTADAGQELPTRGRLLELPFRGERDHEHKRLDGINYMMSFQVESMSAAVYSKTHHELARLGARRGLFVPFPMWMNRSLTPFTFIDHEAKADQFHVFTFHAFPEDLAVVKTQSIFELG